MSAQELSLWRLRVLADADPGVIARVLERLQNFNAPLRRVIAEFATNDLLHIEVDVLGLPEQQMTLVAKKISQSISVLNAYWHRV